MIRVTILSSKSEYTCIKFLAAVSERQKNHKVHFIYIYICVCVCVLSK